VLDEGEGIPAGDLEHIFDKFYRARKTDQVRAGTGLGLAISRGFVEAMHGTISSGNRTDRSGAIFTIRRRSRQRPNHWTLLHERCARPGSDRG
jgi:two-component system sensor histidine kinase KdpD